MKTLLSVLLAASGLLLSPAGAQPAAAAPAPIVFMSDFGTADDAVAQCKGVIYGIAPDVKIFDATHNIPAYDIRLASFFLREQAGFWPAGTVFLAVVDPGVGTARKAIVMKTRNGQYFVGPDNGIFTLPARLFGVEETRGIVMPGSSKNAVTATFHGRDVFSPAAALVAKNPEQFKNIGPLIANPVLSEWAEPVAGPDGIEGSVMFVEPAYGNVWTDIGETYIRHIAKNQNIAIRISGREITLPLTAAFGDVSPGKPLAYINSRGFLSLALNMADFAKKYGVKPGDPVRFGISDATFIDIGRLPAKNIHLDIRYATAGNFAKTAVYPAARCYLRKPAADGLAKAAALAEKDNFSLCVLDCYRPLAVQEAFWKLIPDERYVADPKKGSKHNRGMAVDVAACDAKGNWLELPTQFDDFSGKAAAASSAGSPGALANRSRLQKAMTGAGFEIFPSEWWHFDFPGWEKAGIENFPFAAE
ncbi:MAG: SAM-dependent chlorinase/fluorinase [Elusimicrobiaceae bacterium]|nr:SAM-dependent chlorinase/fluorinase [Elusimicrobiaceae bacterium]